MFVAPSETAIAEAEAQLENKRVTRDEKVAALAAKTALVINGAVGNPAYAPDSGLYGAMGYACRAVAGCEGGSANPSARALRILPLTSDL
jgi:hypothetical protein